MIHSHLGSHLAVNPWSSLRRSADLWAGPPPQSLLDEVAVPGVCGPGCRPALGPPGCPDEVRAPTPGQKRSRPPALEPTADSNCDGVVCECAVPLLAADRLIEMSDRCRCPPGYFPPPSPRAPACPA